MRSRSLLILSSTLFTYHSLHGAHHADRKISMQVILKPTAYDHVGKYKACKKKGEDALTTLHQDFKSYNALTQQHAVIASLYAHNKEAVQFYAQEVDLWPIYQNVLKQGHQKHVRMLLPLLATQKTTPHCNYDKKYQELPIDDCSGLVTVVNASSLYIHEQQELLDLIIKFYLPPNSTCPRTWCFNCKSLCNARRTAFILYGLAKAGEKCIELKKSYDLFYHIYATCHAFVTQDAIKLLREQNKDDLAERLQKIREKQGEASRLLSTFASIQLPDKNDPCGYYEQLARPVINNRRPDASSLSVWPQLCSKE